MSDLNDPHVRPHCERLASFAEECGLTASQLEKLSRLVLNLYNARAAVQKQKQRETNESLWKGTGI